MSARIRFALVTLLLTASSLQAQVSPPKPAAPAPAKVESDPLGRSTPRSALVGFLRYARQNRYDVAGQFLEDGRNQDLARQLEAVLDMTLEVNLNEISDDPGGRLDDDLPPDRERIGRVRRNGMSLDIVLHRVRAGSSGEVWLFSRETLRQIPAIYDELSPGLLEQYVPARFKRQELFGIETWRLLGTLLLVPIAAGVAWLTGAILLWLARSVSRRTPEALNAGIVAILKGPLRLFVTVLLFHVGALFLGLPLLFRQGMTQVELVLAVFAVAWFAVRLIDLAAGEMRQFLIRTHRSAAISMVPLFRRIVKVLALSLAVLAVLDNAGFDLKAILTGLGVGGIAVALAAQKTLENIFGGLALVTDQPVRVGDFCKFGDSLGTVEDVGLRSTRIRTLDRTLISVPNAQFSAMSLENFAPREKVWFHPTMALRPDSSPSQVRSVLAGLRTLLDEHPLVEKGGHVRLVGFGKAALNIDVFAYVATGDYDQYLGIQEELLLRMMDIIEAAGTSLALPAQTTFLARDRGPHS